MRRKIIQIAESTQLVSLPRRWCLKYGLKKGDEVEVEEKGNKVLISFEGISQKKTLELNINNLEPMILRVFVAIYKKGIDEIKVHFKDPKLLKSIQSAIGKEAVGYEITEQGRDYCIIRQVAGELKDFEPILRRTFLMLVSMAEETYKHMSDGDFEHLKNIAFLEEANNRFTTSCRRALNKGIYNPEGPIGPFYYIVEEVENIADQYKYLCNAFYDLKDKKIKFNKRVLAHFNETTKALSLFAELFFKYDREKVLEIAKKRKALVDETYELFKTASYPNNLLMYHSLLIMQKIFCLLGPILVLADEY